MNRKQKNPSGYTARLMWSLTFLAVFALSCRTVGIGIPGIDERKGSGVIITESRPVGDFERLSIRGTGIINLSQGTAPSLSVTTDDNLMQYILTEVQGNTLVFDITDEGRSENLGPSEPIEFDLVVVKLDEIRIAGSADLRGTSLTTGVLDLAIDGSGNISFDNLRTENLEFSIDGSGNIQVDTGTTGDFAIRVGGSGDIDMADLTADRVEVDIFGSGNIELAGKATTQKIAIIGSGDYRAKDLAGVSIEVRIAGSGTATVWASDLLDIQIPGSGDVRYYGDPQVTQSITGSGDIRSMGTP